LLAYHVEVSTPEDFPQLTPPCAVREAGFFVLGHWKPAAWNCVITAGKDEAEIKSIV
jgi:hypothetical protein